MDYEAVLNVICGRFRKSSFGFAGILWVEFGYETSHRVYQENQLKEYLKGIKFCYFTVREIFRLRIVLISILVGQSINIMPESSEKGIKYG